MGKNNRLLQNLLLAVLRSYWRKHMRRPNYHNNDQALVGLPRMDPRLDAITHEQYLSHLWTSKFDLEQERCLHTHRALFPPPPRARSKRWNMFNGAMACRSLLVTGELSLEHGCQRSRRTYSDFVVTTAIIKRERGLWFQLHFSMGLIIMESAGRLYSRLSFPHTCWTPTMTDLHHSESLLTGTA